MPSVWSSAAWPVEPPLFVVVLVAALYWSGGRRRLVRARRPGRRAHGARSICGLLTILVALDSPLDPLADTLFAAHMAQHVLLLTVAPPLIVLSAPWTQIWQPLPLGFRRTVAKAVVVHPRARPLRATAHALGQPVVAWVLFNVNLLLWHVPALYDATLRNQAVHDLEHALFFFTGPALLGAGVRLRPLPRPARLALARRLHDDGNARRLGARGRARVRADAALLRVRVARASRPGGLSALGDQQIAAGVMWVPGSIAFTIAIVVFFYRWLGPEPENLARTPRRRGHH